MLGHWNPRLCPSCLAEQSTAMDIHKQQIRKSEGTARLTDLRLQMYDIGFASCACTPNCPGHSPPLPAHCGATVKYAITARTSAVAGQRSRWRSGEQGNQQARKEEGNQAVQYTVQYSTGDEDKVPTSALASSPASQGLMKAPTGPATQRTRACQARWESYQYRHQAKQPNKQASKQQTRKQKQASHQPLSSVPDAAAYGNCCQQPPVCLSRLCMCTPLC